MDNLFQPWEVPFDEGELKCHPPIPGPGKDPEWHLQLVASESLSDDSWKCYFRRTHSRGDGSFIFSFRHWPKLLRYADKPYALRTSLQDCLKQGKFARTYFLNAEVQLRKNGEKARWQLEVFPSGYARLQKLSELGSQSTTYLSPGIFAWAFSDVDALRALQLHLRSFEFPRPSESQIHSFLHIPALDLWHRIRSELDDANSDAAFALKQSNLPEAGHKASITLYENGDGEQMKEVLGWLMLALEPELEQHLMERSEIDDYFELEGDWSLKIDWRTPPLSHILKTHSFQDIEYPAPAMLEEAISRVLKWFTPRLNTELCERHLSAALTRYKYDFFEVKLAVDNPTAHQRLEGAMSWREWLESH